MQYKHCLIQPLFILTKRITHTQAQAFIENKHNAIKSSDYMSTKELKELTILINQYFRKITNVGEISKEILKDAIDNPYKYPNLKIKVTGGI